MPRNPLFRLLAVNALSGAGLALAFVGGLIWFDPRLARLMTQDENPAAAFIVLAGGFIVTFASLVMGSAIMALREDKTRGGPGRRVPPALDHAEVRAAPACRRKPRPSP